MKYNYLANKYVLSILSGILLVLSWIANGFPLLLFFGFVPLLWVSDTLKNKSTRKANWDLFSSAYLCFFVFNIGTTYWLCYASAFGMWFAVLANSLLMSLVFFIYHLISKKATYVQGGICLVALWVCFEKFHMNWDFSWPWLNLGNGFARFHEWIQWYEYTGTLGGTVWVLACNVLFFGALKIWITKKNKSLVLKKIIAGGCLIIIGIYSSLYLYHNPKIQAKTKIKTLILQPNIDPYTEKYKKSNWATANDLVALAQKKMDSSVTFVVAPETTLSGLENIQYFAHTRAYLLLKNFIKEYPKSSLLCGITFFQKFDSSVPKNATANTYQNSKNWYNAFNSSFFISNAFSDFKHYHKSKLVVGVEHIPYRNFFEPLMGYSTLDLGGSLVTLSTQKNRVVFSHQNTKIAPVICYESVYGNYVREYIKKGAKFLSIITNDGWWADSQGHQQHLLLAKLRAIETRKQIVRSANTGVSAVINTKGDIEQSLPYGKKASIKATITTNDYTTFYVQYGDYLFGISLLLLLLIVPTLLLKNRKQVY